jgi:hypothetical protein
MKDFWSRVEWSEDIDACWPWRGARSPNGYGTLGRRSPKHGKWTSVGAHRVAYELVWGAPPEGAVIMHMCDNPACCNPNHLRAGTGRDNSIDCREKRRMCGSRLVLTEKGLQATQHVVARER